MQVVQANSLRHLSHSLVCLHNLRQRLSHSLTDTLPAADGVADVSTVAYVCALFLPDTQLASSNTVQARHHRWISAGHETQFQPARTKISAGPAVTAIVKKQNCEGLTRSRVPSKSSVGKRPQCASASKEQRHKPPRHLR
jgi:hypothetical protein